MLKIKGGVGIAALALIAASLMPAPAGAFRFGFDLPVVTVPGSRDFEVIEERGAGPRQIWCRAGEHGREVLRLPQAQRLYIARGLGASDLAAGRVSVRFSPEVVAATGPARSGRYAVSLRDVGYSLTIGHALRFCDDRFEELFDRDRF